MIDPKAVWKQLMQLRDITARTAALHEAQILQVKYWAAIVCGKGDTFEISMDPDKKNAVFDYALKRRADAKMVPRVHALDRSVKKLLGDDWLIRVWVNGSVIFVGKRKQPVARKAPAEDEKTPWRDRMKSQSSTRRPSSPKRKGPRTSTT